MFDIRLLMRVGLFIQIKALLGGATPPPSVESLPGPQPTLRVPPTVRRLLTSATIRILHAVRPADRNYTL